MLEALGATVVIFPTIEITDPESWVDCDSSVRNLRLYDCLLFTSSNAVTRFVARVERAGETTLGLLAKKRTLVVGSSTAHTAERCGLHPTLLPGARDSGSLAGALQTESVSGKRFLLPRGNLAAGDLAEGLRNRGATVDEVVVYRTNNPAQNDALRVTQALASGKNTVVTFFSPSSIKNFLSVIAIDLVRNAAVAVIGRTTADATRACGLHVDLVAGRPSAAGLVSSIVRFYDER